MAINIPKINIRLVNELGQATQAFFRPLSSLFTFVNKLPVTHDFAGSPEGNVFGKFKDQCWDTANDKLYFKSTLTGNTGWIILN